MKKSLFIIASAALVLSSCAEDALRNEIKGEEQAISFETFAQKATRAGEDDATANNSGATPKWGLERYHNNFAVWGSKYIGTASGEGTHVFENQLVTAAASGDWSYTPIRFWDKSARAYDFYAAAPADLPESYAWNFDFVTKKISLASFTVSAASLAPSYACSSDAVMASGDYDLMISHDVTREGNYDKINLLFDHILSRINLAVRKADVLNGFTVKLDQVMIYNMCQTGSFNEASADANASGNATRWNSQTKSYDFGYAASGDAREEIASGDAYYYVYQGLVIPQTAVYESIELDGTNASSTSMPYIKIGYTLQDASGDVPGGSYVYTYNLATLFQGNTNASGDVTFNEGWQNTLKITIKPDVIEFCAEVFDWDGQEKTVTVPNNNASGDAPFK